MTLATDLVPPVPGPPHEPTWWLLADRPGWRIAASHDVEPGADGRLRLAPAPGAARSLGEASGSFGGLVPPAGVTVTHAGEFLLLDGASATLKRFDPCACAFVDLIRLGGPHAGALAVAAPTGIAAINGDLVVCDTGHRRVLVVALRSRTPRAVLTPPPGALPQPWEPVAVAVRCGGEVLVGDPANGVVHRFSRHGRWLAPPLPGAGAVRHLAVDGDDRVYIRTDAGAVHVLSAPAGAPPPARDAVAGRFPPLPFAVDADGRLLLGAACVPPREDGAVFDLHGAPVLPAPAPAGSAHVRRGWYHSEPLDSGIYRCPWHRVILAGAIPQATGVRVSTYTAEVAASADTLRALPEDAWATGARAQEGDAWDCLVRSGPGRHLHLRLELDGNGQATPALERVKVEYPRVSLRRHLPAVFGVEPESADFADRFLSLFDTTLRSIECDVDGQARLFDPRSAPTDRAAGGATDFLGWLGTWIGVSLNRHWPADRRRRFLASAARGFHIRGTRLGLHRQLLLYLGLDAPPPHRTPLAKRCRPAPANCAPAPDPPAWEPPPLILEHYQVRRWLFVGQGRLGDEAVLWGQAIVARSQLGESAEVDRTRLIATPDPLHDPFGVFAHKFSVFVPAACADAERRRGLETLIASEKPAHTQAFIRYVEPRFRIGVQSAIGLDAVIGRYPRGVQIDASRLGGDSVLDVPGDGGGVPSLAIGATTRVGTSARLD